MTKTIVASHRRSGTHLTIDSILNNFNGLQNYVNLDDKNITYEDIANGKLFKTHAHGEVARFFKDYPCKEEIVRLFETSKVVYVVRHPIRVVSSLLNYVSSFDDRYAGMTLDDFILTDNTFDSQSYDGRLNRAQYWGFHVSSWIGRCDLVLSYEKLMENFSESLSEIADSTKLDFKNSTHKDVRIASKYQYWKRRVMSMILNDSKTTSVHFNKGQVNADDVGLTNRTKELIESVLTTCGINMYSRNHLSDKK